jgi:regulator of sigma E protease
MLDILTSAPHYVVSFLILLTVVVFVHELGHFWVARRCGVRCEVFSIGFGPELIGFNDRYGTRWKFSAIPLGGYVKMLGQSDWASNENGAERPLTEAEKAVSFHYASLPRRAAIVAAGPAANYVLAVVAFALLFATVGQPILPSTVGDVAAGSAAEAVGLQPGDRILSIDGQPTTQFDELATLIQQSGGRPVTLTVKRADQQLSLTVQPRLVEDKDIFGEAQRTYRLGVRPASAVEYQRVGLVDAATSAVSQTFYASAQILHAVWEMITGSRSSEELGGVLRIGKIAGDVAKKGIVDFLFLIPMLSINLGLLNLFPIPLLDGGHLAFYVAEGVRGRPLGERAQEWGMRFGIALVLGLMVFATWNDLVYLKVVDFIKDLVT